MLTPQRGAEAAGLPCREQSIVSAPESIAMTMLPSDHDHPRPAGLPGTVRFDWLAIAAAQRGKSLHLVLALAWLASTRRACGVSLTRRTLAKWSLSRDASYDALRRLEAAKLIHVWRLPGRAPHVILTEPGTDTPLKLT